MDLKSIATCLFLFEDGFEDEACQGIVEPISEGVNIKAVEFVEDGVRMRGALKLSGCLVDGLPERCGVAEGGDDLLVGVERSFRPWKLEPLLQVVEGECKGLVVELLAWGAHDIHLLVIWFWVCPMPFNVQIDFRIILIPSHCDLLTLRFSWFALRSRIRL